MPKIKQTVVRAGFGMNYTVGEYASFATTMAHQPPFTNEQTNQEAVGNTRLLGVRATVPMTCFTLANGFPAPATMGNYALDPHYGLPYVMAWNLDIQKTLPWGIVMNLGYNGSRANHLDVKLAPRALPGSPGTDPIGPARSPTTRRRRLQDECRNGAREQAAVERHIRGRELPVRALHRRCQVGERQLAAPWCRTGRIRPRRKATRSSTFATR